MEVVKDDIKAEKPVATYDPSKHYEWKPETVFSFTGQEFGAVLNALRAILATQESQRILLAERAAQILENGLARGVEKGTVTEKTK